MNFTFWHKKDACGNLINLADFQLKINKLQ